MILQAVSKYLLGVLLVGVMMFLPAGTLQYQNGWLLMGTLFVPMLIVGIVLLCKAPELLKKRLHAKEKQKAQTIVVKLSGLMFLLGFAVAGMDHRFVWSELPQWVSWAAAAILLLSYLLYAVVLRENPYLSRTVELQEAQKVVDTGLYGIVRHPMYAATVFMFLSMPMVLGSAVSLPIFLGYPLIIAARIRNEEAVLEKELHGYAEYKQRVKYRLLPFIW